jgi:nucleotide-binding universal stress UspA family protein
MRVLLAVDGSAAADVAVDLVQATPWPDGSAIHVLEAVGTAAMIFGGPMPAAAYVDVELEAKLRDTARATLDGLRDRLERPGVTVSTAVVSGRAATAIIDAAHSLEVDLVVVGSRGYGLIERMLLGSVSAEVVDHAPCPVLVARGSGITDVVLGWDGSRCAAQAAALLRSWPIFASSRIRVVSAADVEMPWWAGFPEVGAPERVPIYVDAANASRREHDALAGEMAEQLRAAGLTAEPERRDGDAAAELIAAAEQSHADLIVVGTRGRTGLTRLLLGSVARNVVQHAPCSVLVAR